MPTAHDEPAGSTRHSTIKHPHPDPHVVIVPDDISSITGPHPDQSSPSDPSNPSEHPDTAFCIALVLAVIDPASGKEGTKEIGWGVVLLIAGIVTFINMLESAGIVTVVANNVAHIGTPLVAALLMLANTEQYLYDRTMEYMMTWAFSMIIVAPVTTWLVFLVL